MRAVLAVPVLRPLLVLVALDNLLLTGPLPGGDAGAGQGGAERWRRGTGPTPRPTPRAQTFFFLGLLVASAGFWVLLRRAPKGRAILVGIVLDGLTFLPLAFCHTLGQVQVALFFHAVAVPLMIIPRTVLVQQLVPGPLHGRAFALLNVTVFGMTAVSTAATGVLAEVVPHRRRCTWCWAAWARWWALVGLAAAHAAERPMSAGDRGRTLEVQPQALDGEGAGLVATAGVQLHVAGALPGELVAAAVEHVSPHRGPDGAQAWARTLRVLAASPERRRRPARPTGPAAAVRCSTWTTPRSWRWKRRQVVQALAGVPGVERAGVQPCLPSPRTLGYRNQAKYVYGPLSRGGPPVLGAYAPRSHQLVDLAGCRVVEPAIDEVAAQLRAVLAQRRRARLRRAPADGAAALRGAASERRRPGAGRRWWSPGRCPTGRRWPTSCGRRRPAVVGVVQSLNADAGNVIFAGRERRH